MDIDDLEFDLTKLLASDIEDIAECERKLAVREQSKIYARVITAVPVGWGDPAEPETFSSRPIAEFWGIGRALMEAVKKEVGA
jgi:hypothetical protein